MAKAKKENPIIDKGYAEIASGKTVLPCDFECESPRPISLLGGDFGREDLNSMRDKINEIIKNISA